MAFDPLDTYSFSRFAPLVDSTLLASVDGSDSVPLTLVDATDHLRDRRGSAPVSGLAESFSLLFVGPLDRPLQQGTYAFSHEALGTMPIFIVPVGRDSQGFQYEAVFTTLTSDSAPAS